MFSLLIFMFCFFLGSIVMFFYSLKKRESQFRSLNEEHAQLRVLLRAMESRMENMEKYLGNCSVLDSSQQLKNSEELDRNAMEDMDKKSPEHDPLLHLSFEDPGKMEAMKNDPKLELLLDAQEGKSGK